MRNVIYLILNLFLGSLLIGAIIIAAPVIGMNKVLAQTATTIPVTTPSPSSVNATTSSSTTNLELSKRMAEIEYSNKPQDIATLDYIWGYPLVTFERSFNYFINSSANPQFSIPKNTISFNRELANASITDILRPNADTLYGIAWLDLRDGPLVLTVPPIPDNRYYVFEFVDAYINNFAYLGTRTSGSNGGTYLIVGPDWYGKLPNGMTEIRAPTNQVLINQRILVFGPSDLDNVHELQDKINLRPLTSSLLSSSTSLTPRNISMNAAAAMNSTLSSQANTTTTISSSSSLSPTNVSKTQGLPVKPQASFIPKSGIKVYDEISK